MSTFNPTATSTSDEVASAFAQELKGRNVLITGTSLNGLGFESARVIAKYANLVIITGYNKERKNIRIKLSEDALKQEVPEANIRPLILDLASLDAVRAAAAEVNAYPEQIDILINNAASSLCGFNITVDGFEQQMATDHLGPFLFTALILPKILAAQNASFTPRVIFVSSGAHAWCEGINVEEMEHPDASTYKAMVAYAQAKSANILTAIELSRRAGGRVHAYSLSPGAIVTNFVQNLAERLANEGTITEDGKPNMNSPYSWKTIPQGAATIVAAAFDPSLKDKPGCYLFDSVESNQKVAPHSSDPDTAKKVWSLSERLVGVKFL
ncbi:NAD-P-binding protein [Mycena capillaripes]|nr:NAD-P-binding protein [Mycena capillaripes]